MALVEISADDEKEAKQTLGPSTVPTGRLRWWKLPSGAVRLQCEWSNKFVEIWIDVPIISEITE